MHRCRCPSRSRPFPSPASCTLCLVCLARSKQAKQHVHGARKVHAVLSSPRSQLKHLTVQTPVAEYRFNFHVFRHSTSCIEHPHELQQKHVLRTILSEVDAMDMEPDPLHATPPIGHAPSRPRQRKQPLQRDQNGRSPTLRPGRTPKDQKLRRAMPRSVGNGTNAPNARGDASPLSRSATTKLYSPVTNQPKSLLPLAERRSQEDETPHRKFAKDESRLDITPDGGSAGREGRHFAVWNVGNNGRIYLRYVVGWAENQTRSWRPAQLY